MIDLDKDTFFLGLLFTYLLYYSEYIILNKVFKGSFDHKGGV